MSRALSLVQPTGTLHLGGYLGAFKHWVGLQDSHDAFFGVADLHALTFPIDPARLRAGTLAIATTLLATGLDPDRCTLFAQSHVQYHTRLAWLMECTATYGEMSRMTQFKDKSAGKDSLRVGFFTYPALMAADILLYDTDVVPVGDDQRQHLELTRDLAVRFNHHYGETFVVPQAMVAPVAARVMNLQAPTKKMSKSDASPLGTIDLLDPPEAVKKKISKAVTDTESEVRYDRQAKPGVSNLLELLGAATGRSPADVAENYTRYGDLKSDTAEAISEMLAPIQARHAQLAADPASVEAILAHGAAKADAIAAQTYARASAAIGLLKSSVR